MPFGRQDIWAISRLGDATWAISRLGDKAFGRQDIWATRRLGDKTFGRQDVWAIRHRDVTICYVRSPYCHRT